MPNKTTFIVALSLIALITSSALAVIKIEKHGLNDPHLGSCFKYTTGKRMWVVKVLGVTTKKATSGEVRRFYMVFDNHAKGYAGVLLPYNNLKDFLERPGRKVSCEQKQIKSIPETPPI